MGNNQTTNKHRYDLASAAAGVAAGVAGVAAGAAAVAAVAVAAGVAGVAAGAAAVAAVAVAAGAIAGARPRHAIIGCLTGLATYGAIMLGSAVGYNRATEKRLVPFETKNDRGVMVQRNDGTQVPYIFDEQGTLVPYRSVKESRLESITGNLKEEHDKREADIYNSVAPKK